MLERWQPVPSWEGYYEVSFTGSVRSVDRHQTVFVRGKKQHRFVRGKRLRPGVTGNGAGYYWVTLSRPGHQERWLIHQLVALVYWGPCPAGEEVCHENGRKLDNHFLNLRYDTRSANALDRHKHGTMNLAYGEAHYFHKLTIPDVLWIRQNVGRLSQRAMGRRLGVSHRTIGYVVSGETWKQVA